MAQRRAAAGSVLRRSDTARRRMRRYLIDRDGLTCARCGELIIGELPSIGHRIAQANGGSDHASNLALEHLICNVAAGARAPMTGEFFSELEVPRQSPAAWNGARNGMVRRIRLRIGVMPPDRGR